MSTDGIMRETLAEETSVEKFTVVLARPGVGAKKYYVPEGTTMKGLLEAAGASLGESDIMIDNNKVSLDHVLQPQTVVFMVPKPKNAV